MSVNVPAQQLFPPDYASTVVAEGAHAVVQPRPPAIGLTDSRSVVASVEALLETLVA